MWMLYQWCSGMVTLDLGFLTGVFGMVELKKKCKCGRHLFLCNNMEICLVCNRIKKW